MTELADDADQRLSAGSGARVETDRKVRPTVPVDDGEQEATPVAEVSAAVASLRMAAESTGEGIAMDQPGWRYVPEAYRLLGQLSQLAEVLPQLLVGIRESVTHELELNLIAMDAGSPYQGRPDAAVQEMADGIDTAVAAARELSSGVAAAADALT